MINRLLIILTCACLVYCKNSHRECGDVSCVEKELIGYIDKLEDSNIPILKDYVVLQKSREGSTNESKNEDLIERCLRYLANHELRMKIPMSETRSLESEGRSRRLRKILLPLLLILKLKAAIVIPIVLSIIALVAFKGLGAGLTALVIAGATGLKSLLQTNRYSRIEILPQIVTPWSRSGIERVEPIVPITPLGGGYHTIP